MFDYHPVVCPFEKISKNFTPSKFNASFTIHLLKQRIDHKPDNYDEVLNKNTKQKFIKIVSEGFNMF